MPKLLFVMLFLGLSVAHARPPMIQVGGGVEADSSGEVSVLLAVNFAGIPDLEATLWYYARLRGEVAFNGQGVPYLDIRFAPLGVTFDEFGAELLPVHIQRNVSIDNAISVRVTAVGFRAGTNTDVRWGGVIPFARMAVDALGFKTAHFLEHQSLHGFSLAAADVAVGLVGETSDETFDITIAFGARADVAFALSGAQSDARLYTELSSSFVDFFRVFVRGAYNAYLHSAYDPRTEWQLIAGAGFQF